MDQNIFSKENRNHLIEKNKSFIYDTTCYFCNRELIWQDEEVAIALIAFNNACDSQEEIKGSFLSYAYAIIRSTLLDYYIKLENTPILFFDSINKNFIDLCNSLNDFEVYYDNKERAREIDLLIKDLNNFHIKYKKLAKNLIDIDKKNQILNLAVNICKNKELLNQLLTDKKFKVSNLSDLSQLNKNDITKYKQYIMTLLIIISSEKYVYLKAYLDIKVGVLSA